MRLRASAAPVEPAAAPHSSGGRSARAPWPRSAARPSRAGGRAGRAVLPLLRPGRSGRQHHRLSSAAEPRPGHDDRSERRPARTRARSARRAAARNGADGHRLRASRAARQPRRRETPPRAPAARRRGSPRSPPTDSAHEGLAAPATRREEQALRDEAESQATVHRVTCRTSRTRRRNVRAAQGSRAANDRPRASSRHRRSRRRRRGDPATRYEAARSSRTSAARARDLAREA